MGASTQKTYNTFIKGLITEAGPLTFPENASIAEENCVLNRDGSRQRRLGMDFEDGFVLVPATLTSTMGVASYLWENVGNDATKNFAVVQVGQSLYIFDAAATAVSAAPITVVGGIGFWPPEARLEFAAGNGWLFISGSVRDLLYLEYNAGTGAVSLIAKDIFVRDVWGVDDTLAVDTQPASLSTTHNYNLLNQGWPGAKISAYHTTTSVYPSNAQQWFLGRKDDNTFDPNQLKEMEFGTTPAPRGKFLISPFSRSLWRDARSGITTPIDGEATNPTTVEFAFQRIWLAGMQSDSPLDTATSPNLTGMVLYSRTIRGTKDFNQFHSDADPTSEIDSELVDTDGGFVIIPDSGKIHRLLSLGASVVVLAENGVWEINGGDQVFSATNQQVRKISSFGAVAPRAVVDAESTCFYWSKGGIYMLSGATGQLSATNVTENSIQTLYNKLDLTTKRNAVGTYDAANKTVKWMYNDDLGYTGVTFAARYIKELILDLSLEAWYLNSISSLDEPSPYIAGYLPSPDFLLRKEGVRSRGDTFIKYLVVQFVDPSVNAASVSFAYYRDETFRDWKSLDATGVSFLSYFVTGYEIMGDTARDKQAPYIIVHQKRTETAAITNDNGDVVPNNPSGLYMQAQWGWSDSGSSGRWANPQQVYRLPRPYTLETGQPIDYGDSVVSTKNRVRGKGKALSLYFYSDGDKDFYLHGWAVTFAGKQNV